MRTKRVTATKLKSIDPRAITVVQGENLDVLERIPSNTFDITVTSPPYEKQRPYGDQQFALYGDAWVGWCLRRLYHACRVTRGLTCFVVDVGTKDREWSHSLIKLQFYALNLGLKPRKPIIYHRDGIMGTGGRDYLGNKYETVLVYGTDRLTWSDNVATGGPPKYKPGGPPSHRKKDGTRVRGKAYKPPDRVNPGNVISGSVGGGKMGHPIAHENEAPFPEWLVEPIVRSFCRPAGLILDCFSGSGTTLAVAKKWGRYAIGLELDRKQCSNTVKRLSESRWEESVVGEHRPNRTPPKTIVNYPTGPIQLLDEPVKIEVPEFLSDLPDMT